MTISQIEREQEIQRIQLPKKVLLTLEYSQVLFKINVLILEQIMSDRRGSMHMEG